MLRSAQHDSPLSFPRVRGNQKGASPACGGIRRGPPPRAGESEGGFPRVWGIKGGTGVALMVTLGFGRAGVEMLRSAQHDSPLSFPRVRGNQKGAFPACGGLKGGTGVALMATLGFGRAGVEMLRSAQHHRLVL